MVGAISSRQPSVFPMSNGHADVRLSRCCRSSSAEIVACRACPRLVAWREEVAAHPAGRLPGRGVLGLARCPGLATPPRPSSRRSGAGRPRRQPHRSGVHWRPVRRTGCSRRCTGAGWPTSPPRPVVTTGCELYGVWVTALGSLRPAGQPAHPRGAGPMSAVPRARAGPASRRRGCSWRSGSSPTTSSAGCSLLAGAPVSVTAWRHRPATGAR